MNYTVIDKENYYRKGAYENFTKGAKCSVSMTGRIDVSRLIEESKKSGTKFYINFLYLLSKVLNSRDDYKMAYFWETDELVVYDKINPKHYVFFEEKEICTPVYTEYEDDYQTFYQNVLRDTKEAQKRRSYDSSANEKGACFDASYIPWFSCDSVTLELPDGYPYYAPIVTWSNYRSEDGTMKMPVTVRMNHAAADGYHIALIFKKLEEEIQGFRVLSKSGAED